MLQLRGKLAALSLSDKQVSAREKRREALGQGVTTPWFVRIPYNGAALPVASLFLYRLI